MGYDQHPQPNSSGSLVAVIGVGLVLAILAIISVAAVGLFWVRAARVESRDAVVAEQQRAVEEALRAKAMTLRSALEQARAEATPDPRLNFELNLDLKGNTSVDGQKIDLDELKAKLVQLKDETSNAFSVHINANPECPVKYVIPVLDLCDQVGDIDYRVLASNVSADESKSEK